MIRPDKYTVEVRYQSGAYNVSAGKHRASATHSPSVAVECLAEQLFPDGYIVQEIRPNIWTILPDQR